MRGLDTNQISRDLMNFHIDDSNVNKMQRRRSCRIQNRLSKQINLDNSIDFENNNWIVDKEAANVQILPTPKIIESKFMLERENVHYQAAIKQFTFATQNEYRMRRPKKNFEDAGDCSCTITAEQIRRGELGCGSDCWNREMSIECDQNCRTGKFCSNQRFQKLENANCTVFITEKKGYGLFASDFIPRGTFIMEFVGEVVSMAEFKKRSRKYAQEKRRHCYVMSSTDKALIDATRKGNLTRFTNHSCDPNAETQKWSVNGECRIGIFSKKPINDFEEITINYQFERFGKDAQECFCDSPNCRGWIGS